LAWPGDILLARNRPEGARRILLATLIATAAIAILPLGELLIQPLENRYPANPNLTKSNGIIVLGGAEDAR